MPTELLLRAGDMARELTFVTAGLIEMEKDEAVIQRIRADTGAPTVCGEVAFFLGIAQPYSLRASKQGDVTLVSFAKLDYEDLLIQYPDQQDVILTNILAVYELDKYGSELSKAKVEEDDELFMEMKEMIRGALLKRNSEALSAL